MKTKHGIRRMGREGMINSSNRDMKGEVGNDRKEVMNRGVFVCLCAGCR